MPTLTVRPRSFTTLALAVVALTLSLLGLTPAIPTPPARAEAGSDPRTVDSDGVTRSRTLLGRSTRGRAIAVHRVCGAREDGTTETRDVLVVGAVHGTERAGIPIAHQLLAAAPHPQTCLIVVPTMNPDGDAARTRQNARGVDLNRNFPGGSHTGRPWDPFYGGRSDLSERESRLMHQLILTARPRVLIVYHQRMNVVDLGGGDPALGERYAAMVGMRHAVLTRYRGSMATWTHRALPGTTVITVELPARVNAAMVAAHTRAAIDLTERI